MPTTLTQEALRELEELLSNSRRDLSSVYREWQAGMSLQNMAESRKHKDLKKIKNTLSALRILFGREDLPKVGKGRQQALFEAHYWLHSDYFLSPELTEHFEKILLRGEKTNVRRADSYDPLLPPSGRTIYQESRNQTQDGDYQAVYVVAKKDDYEDHRKFGADLTIKIGWSHNVWERLSNAQTWDPDRLEIMRIFPCKSPNFYEAKFHIVLDTLGCTHGGDGGKEWFSIKDMAIIDSIASNLDLSPLRLDR